VDDVGETLDRLGSAALTLELGQPFLGQLWWAADRLLDVGFPRVPLRLLARILFLFFPIVRPRAGAGSAAPLRRYAVRATAAG
jgi:hypothetical protein